MLLKQIVRGTLASLFGILGGYFAQSVGAPLPIVTTALITAFTVEAMWPSISETPPKGGEESASLHPGNKRLKGRGRTSQKIS